jgi:hypothetical protein
VVHPNADVGAARRLRKGGGGDEEEDECGLHKNFPRRRLAAGEEKEGTIR